MTQPAIVVEEVSKSHSIGRKARESSPSREAIASAAGAPLRRLRGRKSVDLIATVSRP